MPTTILFPDAKKKQGLIGKLRLNLAQVQIEYPEWTLRTLKKLVDELILRKIHSKMKGDGISPKIIASTRVEYSRDEARKTITYKIISDYKAINGFPVAIMIERGRKGFKLLPKMRLVKNKKTGKMEMKLGTLSWIDKVSGERAFSKGHEIPPYTARRYVWRTIHENRARVVQRFDDETVRFIRRILRS